MTARTVLVGILSVAVGVIVFGGAVVHNLFRLEVFNESHEFELLGWPDRARREVEEVIQLRSDSVPASDLDVDSSVSE